MTHSDLARRINAASHLTGQFTLGSAAAAAVTGELLGPDACTPGQAVSLVLQHPAWTSTAERTRRTDGIGRLVEAVTTIDIGA